MKHFVLLTFFLFSVSAYAADVVIFDPATDRVTIYAESVHTPDYEKRADAIINPDLSLLSGVSIQNIQVIPWRFESHVDIHITIRRDDRFNRVLGGDCFSRKLFRFSDSGRLNPQKIPASAAKTNPAQASSRQESARMLGGERGERCPARGC